MVSSTFSRTASSEMPELLEGLGRHPLALVDEAQQDVLGADEAVVEQARFFLRQHQHPPCPVSEAFEHQTASLDGSISETKSTGADRTNKHQSASFPSSRSIHSPYPSATIGRNPDLNRGYPTSSHRRSRPRGRRGRPRRSGLRGRPRARP